MRKIPVAVRDQIYNTYSGDVAIDSTLRRLNKSTASMANDADGNRDSSIILYHHHLTNDDHCNDEWVFFQYMILNLILCLHVFRNEVFKNARTTIYLVMIPCE